MNLGAAPPGRVGVPAHGAGTRVFPPRAGTGDVLAGRAAYAAGAPFLSDEKWGKESPERALPPLDSPHTGEGTAAAVLCVENSIT